MAVINLSRSLGHGLTPDLTKRKRGTSAHTVASWNATPGGVKHPKGADGKWVDRAGLIDAIRSIAPEAHWGQMRGGAAAKTGVHDWTDEELASVAGHAEVFSRKLKEEIEVRRIAREAPITDREAELQAFREKGFEAMSSLDLERMRVLGGEMPEASAPKANPAKPLRAKAPTKPIDPALAERVEAMKKRPIPSDRAYLEEQLPKLTVAQLGELGRFGDWADLPPVGKTKADKVQDVIRRLTNRLSSEAVTHQSSAKGREHYDEYRRRLAAAEARGDRDEYAALVAGFGTGGTGPGLPPEKVPPKQNFSVASDPWAGAAARKAQLDQTLRTSGNPAELEAAAREWGELTGGERHMWIDGYRGDYARMAADNRGTNRKANAGAVADRIGELGSEDEIVAALGGKGAAELRRVGAELGIRFPSGMKDPDALRAHIGRSMMAYGSGDAKPNPAKPLRASGSKHIDNPPEAGESAITKPAAKGVGRISAKDLPEAMAEIDALAANPKTERDRDRVKYLLGRMTLAQIKQVADKHHNGLLIGANKDEKARRLADTIVGTKLDAAGIAGGIQSGAHATRVAALRAATDRETARGWLTGLKLADLKEVADELGMPGGAARPASKGALGEAIVEFTAGNKANSRAIRGGVLDPPAEGSLAARQEQRRLRMTEQPPDELGDLRRQLANVEAAEVSEIDSRRATGMRGEARELRRQIARIESGADEGTVDQPREKTRAEIMAVYSQLVSRPGEILSLVKLRGNLPHIKHDELTEVLKQMDRERLIHLDPDPNTKAIPKSGHDAAIRLGGEDKHFISIS